MAYEKMIWGYPYFKAMRPNWSWGTWTMPTWHHHPRVFKPWDEEGKLDPKSLGRICWARDVGGAHVGPHDFLRAKKLAPNSCKHKGIDPKKVALFLWKLIFQPSMIISEDGKEHEMMKDEFQTRPANDLQVWRASLTQNRGAFLSNQWPLQEPKLKVPTIYKDI